MGWIPLKTMRFLRDAVVCEHEGDPVCCLMTFEDEAIAEREKELMTVWARVGRA